MIYSKLQLYSIFFILLFLIGGVCNNAIAQDYEEWKKNYLQEFKEFQNEYDRQFHEMLQKEWKNYDVDLSPDAYEKPKPQELPTVEEPDTPEPETTVSLEDLKPEEPEYPGETESVEEDAGAPQNFEPPAGEEPSVSEQGLTGSFEPNVKQAEIVTNNLTYFDIPIQYKYYQAFKTRVRGVSKESISNFWKHLSTKDYPPFLDQMQRIRSRLSLNDYGYAQLLSNIGDQIYGKDSPESTLFSWFMLTQSGFGTRLGYNNNVYLLVKTDPQLYNTTYFTINGTKYYALDFTSPVSNIPSQLYTYEGDYPKSNKEALDLLIDDVPQFPRKQKVQEFQFSYGDTTYTFEVTVNRQMIDFYKNYPNSGRGLYFNSKMDQATHRELANALNPLLEGKSNVEKINILLRFVQKTFNYQVDQKQFNREKYMFPEETLFYPASDCEDRAALFGYLVEHLVGLDYVVLNYPNHLAIAVNFPSNPPSGKSLIHDGKTYYVTDPTYINANAGMVMPDYENTAPKIVEI